MLPIPGSLSTDTSPPSFSAKLSAIESPMPAPLYCLVRNGSSCTNGSNILSWSLPCIPMPLSVTFMDTSAPSAGSGISVAATVQSTLPPGAVNFMAFSMNTERIVCIASQGPLSGGKLELSTEDSNRMFFSSAVFCHRSITGPTTPSRLQLSVSFIFLRLFILARVRMFSMSPLSLEVDSFSIGMNVCMFSGDGSSSRRCTMPFMPLRGVLSSWPTMPRNSLLSSSTFAAMALASLSSSSCILRVAVCSATCFSSRARWFFSISLYFTYP